jgi:ubiquinone/menaquinone biosynthesis C-methylase UbiE
MAAESMHDQEILGIAEAIAPGWERRRSQIEELSAPVGEWLLRALDPQPGDTVLELAAGAGAGDTGFDAASVVGPRGQLLCTDFSPAMLAVARRRGDERRVANVEYRLMDAQRIDRAGDSVDGVLCRFGYMLMPDPAGAFHEARRVLRRGGRLALAVWGPPERNPLFAILAGALVARGHLSPPTLAPAPGIFTMAATERISGLLREAGFRALRIEEVPVRIVLPDVGEYVALIADTAGPIGLALQRLSKAELELVQTQAQTACERFVCAGGYAMPGLALCAVGTA